MTARTPLETLTLARDYLDSLLADSTPGPWVLDEDGDWILDANGGTVMITPHSFHVEMSADAALIIALHAAAPAIRELLIWDINKQEYYGISRSLFIAEALLSTPHASQWITDREATQ